MSCLSFLNTCVCHTLPSWRKNKKKTTKKRQCSLRPGWGRNAASWSQLPIWFWMNNMNKCTHMTTTFVIISAVRSISKNKFLKSKVWQKKNKTKKAFVCQLIPRPRTWPGPSGTVTGTCFSRVCTRARGPTAARCAARSLWPAPCPRCTRGSRGRVCNCATRDPWLTRAAADVKGGDAGGCFVSFFFFDFDFVSVCWWPFFFLN